MSVPVLIAKGPNGVSIPCVVFDCSYQKAKEAILLCHRLKKVLEDLMAQPFSEAEFAMIAFQEGE